MYEKPQYLTPDGYRRAKKNPFKSGLPLKEAAQRLAKSENGNSADTPNPPALKETKNSSALQIKPCVANYLRKKQSGSLKQKSGISDKAAMLIAEAIKSLLNSK